MHAIGGIFAIGLLLAAISGPGPLAGSAAAATGGGVTVTLRVTEPAGARVAAPPTCFDRQATIVGTEESEVLIGTTGSDVMVGGGGEDVIRGLAGRDYICRGQQRHFFSQGSTLIGNGGNDHLRGGGGRLRGGLGDDVLRGYQAGIAGGAGNDYLRGWGHNGSSATPGPGRDHVFVGTDGSLVYREATGPVRVNLARGRVHGQGMDILTGEIVDVLGTDFADVLKGDNNNNDFFAGNGNDVYYGRRGNDALWDNSGGGNDTAYGGLSGDAGDSCLNIEHRHSCYVWDD